MWRCTCCGQWSVEIIWRDRGRGPRRWYQVVSRGYLVGDYLTQAEAAAAVAQFGATGVVDVSRVDRSAPVR